MIDHPIQSDGRAFSKHICIGIFILPWFKSQASRAIDLLQNTSLILSIPVKMLGKEEKLL